jgi:ABC-type sugar transport system ATPase subunit
MTSPDRVPVLRVVDITKTFGAANALSDVSFSVMRGEVHALVGENGAGKSTLVKIVTGILEPSSGHIELVGEPRRFVTPVESLSTRTRLSPSFPSLNFSSSRSLVHWPLTRNS